MRFGVVARVPPEELKGLPRRAVARVRQDELFARLLSEILGVVRVLVLLGELEDVDETLKRLPVALAIVFNPGDLVERVAIDRVPLRRKLENLAVELPRRFHVALFVEVVLRKREIGVWNEAAVRVVLDEASIDRARLLELIELLKCEGQREEHLVHSLELRMVANERRVGANAVFADLVELRLSCFLPVARLLTSSLVLVPGTGLVDWIVERAHLGVLRDLHLELGLGQTQENLGSSRIVLRAVLYETLENRDLLL